MKTAARATIFRRLVVSLRDAHGSASSLAAAARLAQAWRSELLGVFVEDSELLAWSKSPLTGHVGLPGGERRGNETGTGFAVTERLVRKRFTRITAQAGVSAGFTVRSGSAMSLHPDEVEPQDLLVVVEPSEPMARASYPFTAVKAAAAAHPGPVLYLPARIGRQAGPVLAIARESDHATLSQAGEIAASLGRDLVRIDPQALGDPSLAGAAGRVGESLIVMPGQAPGRPAPDFAALAGRRKVPVLLLGPADSGISDS